MDVELTEDQKKYMTERVKAGEYESENQLLQEALEMHRSLRQQKLEELRKEIEKGWEGPTCQRTVRQIAQDKLNSIGD